jgi:L-gulono-1,4-lactone dehydrogenase
VSPVWHNHTRNQSCHPRAIEHPLSEDDLRALVRRAELEGTHVRAVGAGHSWSDVALTDGYLICPDALGGMLDLDDGTLAPPPPDAPPMVRVRGGTHLFALNQALDDQGLALPNMGGYDGQTIAGVVSTSTHGSGLGFGPFPDLVHSIDLVATDGELVRVEPKHGITDATLFRGVYGSERRLVQEDRVFHAAVCGLGTMGLVESYVIEVREKFWLKEVRTVDTWENVRDTLTADGVLGEGDHYELFVNPYSDDDGNHTVLVTRRGETTQPHGLPEDKLERHPLTELAASLHLTGTLLSLAARFWPSLLVSRFDSTLMGMVDDDYTNVSYKVFNIGNANDLPAYSMELGVTLENEHHLTAVQRLMDLADELRQKRRLYQTSPMSLRFVAPSEAFASMMYHQPTMMIELIMVAKTRRGEELLRAYEDGLADLKVRPHWGQINSLNAARVRTLYPRWTDWLAVEAQFNASGVFDSEFTRRVGIS